MADQIKAQHSEIHPSARIPDSVRISAERVSIGPDVVIGEGANILCDDLTLGPGCRIAGGAQITCPEITLAEGCSLGAGFVAEVNQFIRLGRHSGIAKRVTVAAQGLEAGEFFYVCDDVRIGGGGNKGPDSFCMIGDHVMVVDRTFINVSERVTIGNNTGISYNVVIMTHGQPVQNGHPGIFAPVTIGSFVNIYLNVTLLPGVTVGSYTTVAANSLVNKDIPAHCLAAGVPAVIKRENYLPMPSQADQEQLVRQILRDYTRTLALKEVEIVEDRLDAADWFSVRHAGRVWRIGYGALPADPAATTITLDFGPPGALRGEDTHFDFSDYSVSGAPSALAEDLRDYLRRRVFRFSTDRPFRSIPLANLARLRARQ